MREVKQSLSKILAWCDDEIFRRVEMIKNWENWGGSDETIEFYRGAGSVVRIKAFLPGVFKICPRNFEGSDDEKLAIKPDFGK